MAFRTLRYLTIYYPRIRRKVQPLQFHSYFNSNIRLSQRPKLQSFVRIFGSIFKSLRRFVFASLLVKHA
jgi:hypothetical protein